MARLSDLILVDGHVHFQRGFEAGSFLEWAHANFRDAAEGMTPDASFVGVLLLTEGQQENGFNRLIAQVERQNGKEETAKSKWSLQGTREQISTCFYTGDHCTGDHAPIFIVAGRQIPTREGLEVLAAGTRRQFEEGKPIEMLIREVAKAGAIPIVPWGAGKWIGKRGRVIDEVIRNPRLPPFFLGDSANRPVFWPRPAQFHRAEEEGIRVLSGSDPLPFSGEERRVGSFGVALNGALGFDEPFSDLKRRLMGPSSSLRQFGGKERPLRFVRNQLKMQFRKLTR
jgi:hypothetical protein